MVYGLRCWFWILRLQTISVAELTAVLRTGVICIILCFALGIANIFNFNLLIIFSVICL